MSLLPKLLLVTMLSCLAGVIPWMDARADFVITRVALTGDTAPANRGVFTGFQFPSLDAGVVAFVASFNDGVDFGGGVLKGSSPGGLALLVEAGDSIPLSQETFLRFCSTPSIETGVVAFCADDTTQPFSLEGIYEAGGVGPQVRTVVDVETAQPGSSGSFSGFGKPSRDGGALAFAAVGSTGLRGVYRTGGGGVVIIADANTTVPGTNGTFAGSSLAEPSLDNGMVAFNGTENAFPAFARRGIYLDDGVSSGLSVIADSTDAAPGSGELFQAFSSPSLSGGAVAFTAAAGGLPAVYVGDAVLLEVVADTTTAIPGGDGLFIGFGDKVSHDLGHVAFLGFGNSEQAGVYVDRSDGPEKVVAHGDLLDGRMVAGVAFRSEGLSGDQLTFRADFEDGAQGIYLVSLPEPGAALSGVAALLTIGLCANRRGARARLPVQLVAYVPGPDPT